MGKNLREFIQPENLMHDFFFCFFSPVVFSEFIIETEILRLDIILIHVLWTNYANRKLHNFYDPLFFYSLLK